MQKYQTFLVVVIAGLVVAVTMLVFQSRALTFKVQALESERSRAAAAPKPEMVSSSPTQGQDLQSGSILVEESQPMPDTRPPALRQPAPLQAKSPAPVVDGAPLTAAQEQAVARSVDRILEEKYGHLPKVHKPEDLEKTLERELSLTASQRERITELLKKKREESSTVFKGGNPFSGKVLSKAMELDAKYETLIKNELDSTQQAKYDQLKKDGKINNGIQIQIDATTDDNEE